MELRKINTNDIEAQWTYTTELPTDENGLTNPYNGVSFEEYKEKEGVHFRLATTPLIRYIEQHDLFTEPDENI